MKDWQAAQQLTEQVLSGTCPSRADGIDILRSSGSEYSIYLAGAHYLKERFFRDKVQLCSIINAKSGQCTENCAFCAQSAHHSSSPPVYPLKSLEEILEGASRAEQS